MVDLHARSILTRAQYVHCFLETIFPTVRAESDSLISWIKYRIGFIWRGSRVVPVSIRGISKKVRNTTLDFKQNKTNPDPTQKGVVSKKPGVFFVLFLKFDRPHRNSYNTPCTCKKLKCSPNSTLYPR